MDIQDSFSVAIGEQRTDYHFSSIGLGTILFSFSENDNVSITNNSYDLLISVEVPTEISEASETEIKEGEKYIVNSNDNQCPPFIYKIIILRLSDNSKKICFYEVKPLSQVDKSFEKMLSKINDFNDCLLYDGIKRNKGGVVI